MYCRKWVCRRCGPARRLRLSHVIAKLPPQRMVTLTADRKQFDSPEHAARVMSAALPKLIHQLRRRFDSEPLEYFAVWERTQAGWPHLHVLMRGPYVPKAVVSYLWLRFAHSFIVDVKLLDGSRSGARYVTKYLTKDPDPFGLGRSYRASAGFLAEPLRPQGQRHSTLGPLEVYRGSVVEWLAAELESGRVVELNDHGQATSAPWSALGVDDETAARHWNRQRYAMALRAHPPPLPRPLLAESPWQDGPAPPRPRVERPLAVVPTPATVVQQPLAW